jgi:hypothetical protein
VIMLITVVQCGKKIELIEIGEKVFVIMMFIFVSMMFKLNVALKYFV